MAITALHSASTGLSALSTKLDVIANNLANVNTDGFKASRVNFQDLLYIQKAQPGVENSNGDMRPTGLYVGLGVKVSGTQADFSQGSLVATGQELDVAIEGKGFFKVTVQKDLAEGGIGYTRAGNFTLNQNGDLVLANDQGRRLNPSITIPPNTEGVSITSSGQVLVQVAGSGQAQQIGQLELATFINPAGLKQIGENLLAETQASGPPTNGNPAQNGTGQLRQGFVEGSNVNPTRELIGLISTQRAFEMNSQSIRTADQTLQTLTQLLR
jgi:flagellar basal-body rod protein FlgG